MDYTGCSYISPGNMDGEPVQRNEGKNKEAREDIDL